MVHRWKATGEIITVNGRDNLPPLFRKKLDAGKVRREQWWPDDMEHEVSLAVNPFAAYAENKTPDPDEQDAWKKAFGDDWCTGTGDGRGWMFDTLYIDDLKTGRDVKFEDHIQQLRFYALASARVLDYRRPVNATITWWPRYPVVSQPERFGKTFEQDELLAFEKKLSELRDTILYLRDGGDVRKHLEPGEKQCLWCPARMNCPALGMEN